MADLSYEDFSAAANRMLAAKKAGQPESPVDRQIFDQGDPIHGQQFYKDYTAARSGGNIPIEDWKADPNIGPYALARTALPIAMAIPDLAVAAGNNLLDPLVNMGRKAVGAEPVAPTTLPSQAIKNALGVPNAPGNLQNLLETGASLIGGAAPAAGAAIANATGGISNAIRAGLGSLFKNAVVAPALSTGATAAADWAGAPEPIKFLAGTAGALAPSVLTPGAMRVAQNYFVPKYASPDAPNVAAAADRLGIPLRFGTLATPEGQSMEAGLRAYPATQAAAAAERPAMQAAGDRIVAQRQALPAATPETQQYVTAAEQARTNVPGPYGAPAPTASSAVNALLNQNVGPRAPVDVGNTLNDINRIAAPQGGTVSPEIGNSLLARGTALQSMATPPPPAAVGPVRPTVPFEQGRSWRSNLGGTYPDMPAIKGAPYAQVYPTITADLERAAADRGVPPAAFRTVMDITRGEKAASSLGDAMRSTVDAPSATGAKNFAQYVADLRTDPYQYRRITGAGTPNDVSGPMSDLATVGRASYMPQKQGGWQDAALSVAKEGHPVISAPLNAILLNTLFGPGAAAVGGAAATLPTVLRGIKSEVLQRPSMIAAMGGGPQGNVRSPWAQAPSMADLIAGLNAARIGQ